MLRETDPQAGLTLWEVLLSAELAKIDAYLDDERPASAAVGGGGLEWPQEGVIDQVEVAAWASRSGARAPGSCAARIAIVTAAATATAQPASTSQAGTRAKPRRTDAMLMASP